MRRGAAAVAVAACALAAAVPQTEAAAQSRVPPGWPEESRDSGSNALKWLFEQDPRLVVRPMAAVLGDGTHEQRVNARLTWPAADTAPDFALHLLLGLAAGRDSYTRSGLRVDFGQDVGPARFTGSATVSAGYGNGPRQAVSLRFGGGLSAFRLEVRTAWLQGAPSIRMLEPSVPSLPGLVIESDDGVRLSFPAGAVSGPTTVTYSARRSPVRPVPAGSAAVRSFRITAQGAGGQSLSHVAQPYTLQVSFTEEQLRAAGIKDAASLSLARWDGKAWQPLPPCQGCMVSAASGTVTVRTDQLGEFALVGPSSRSVVYLPAVRR